jgi:DnaB-like helicase C terminal domain
MSEDKLSKDYVYELIACCINNKKVLEIASTYLKYEYLETDAQKRVVKFLFETYALTGNPPTFGSVSQTYSTNENIIALLKKVRDVKITDYIVNNVLDTFETFIKDVRFQQLYYKTTSLYNEGKQDEAIKILAMESTLIAEFNIKSKKYVEVFSQFEERMTQRERKAADDGAIMLERCTTGIHEFDQVTNGGFRKGTSFLLMARGGVGKSTYLRWVALCNARMGKVVVLFQGESTEDEALSTIDAAWTGVTIENIELSNIPSHLMLNIKRTKKEIQNRGGKVYVIAAEQFNRMTIEECDDILEEIEKIEGRIDLALWDYLEIFSTKGSWSKGESAERRRREDIGEKITNIGTKRKCATGTATQAADIPMDLVNNPDFVMTRNHASEFKNVIKPFSYFFTLNATNEEYDAQWLRIYLDKLRKHPGNRVIKIVQARESGRFYNAAETKNIFYDYNAVNIR